MCASFVFSLLALALMVESRTTSGPTTFTTVSHSSTPKRDGCYYEGKWYLPGEELYRGYDGRNWCYGAVCGKSGQVSYWDNFRCGTTTGSTHTTTLLSSETTETTTVPITTPESAPMTTLPFTPPNGCFQNGKWYRPGEEISRGFDGKTWCYGTYCDDNGNVNAWDDWNCSPTSSSTMTPIPTTTLPPPTTRSGCYYNRKWYRPGEEISSSFDGKNWCYGIYCDENGFVVSWDKWDCGTTTTSTDTRAPNTTPPTTPVTTTTAPPTTTPMPTTINGCFENGKWYYPGETISRGFEEGYDGRNWCYGTYCDYDGSVIADNFECGTTTTTGPTTRAPTTIPTTHAPTTIPTTHAPTAIPTTHAPTAIPTTHAPTTIPTTHAPTAIPSTHAPTISPTTHDLTTIPTTHAPTTIPTTHAPTTIPTTYVPTTLPTTHDPSTITKKVLARVLQRGCFYRGSKYELNSNILESTNGNGWCYGRRCSDDGQVILWDDFSCRPSKSDGCSYGGHKYAYGSELFRIKTKSVCYGGVCGKNGKIKTWTRMSCQKEKQFYGGRLKPSWCKYRGEVYPRGRVFAVKPFKRYGFGWCTGAKCVANGRIVTWGPKWFPGYC